MNSDCERRLINNRILLQNEVIVEDFVDKMVTRGGFTREDRSDVKNVFPCTRQMKSEQFVKCLIKSGNNGYHVFCGLLKESVDNRYKQILERLQNTPLTTDPGNAAEPPGNSVPVPVCRPGSSGRPTSSMSNSSSGTEISTRSIPSRDGETGERNIKARRAWRSGSSDTESLPPSSGNKRNRPDSTGESVTRRNRPDSTGEGVTRRNRPDSTGEGVTRRNRPDSTGEGAARRNRPDSTGERNSMAGTPNTGETTTNSLVASTERSANNEEKNQVEVEASNSTVKKEDENSNQTSEVDMQTLEKELVRIAPTIADLFKKITMSKPVSGIASQEELERIKGENERLRKTNKTLIEKLNTFQQKIIQLQLENKKLRENGDAENCQSEELQQKSVELDELEKRLESHKLALEEKEEELNAQLQKIKEIEKQNERHKKRIGQLEILHEEGELARLEQQNQIEQLEDDKDSHRKQITALEENQQIGEERLYRLEERLKMLEQGAKSRRRGTRVMSPTRTNPWMSGVIDRSHHANVKFNPPKKATGSSWSF